MKPQNAVLPLLAAAVSYAGMARADVTLNTLASFNGANGANPLAGLALGPDGNFYGTAAGGGASSEGAVFELVGTNLTALASFSNGISGQLPSSVPVFDSAGNLYGTTSSGGSGKGGAVFEIPATNRQTVITLASFPGAVSTEEGPYAGVTIDNNGNLFGTTFGSEFPYMPPTNVGTVFELPASNRQTPLTLVSFTGSNGLNPHGTLISDSSDNLYGTAEYGGTSSAGIVYELTGPSHTNLVTLYTFSGSDGRSPYGELVSDPSGNLYGVTRNGGSADDGAIFQLSGSNHQTFTTLATFNGSNGAAPMSGLTFGPDGNLYGVTYLGGGSDDGTVYELSGTNLITLVSFSGTNGANPDAVLLTDASGDLYGTTQFGGNNNDGTVFEVMVPEPVGLTFVVGGATLILTGRRRRRISS